MNLPNSAANQHQFVPDQYTSLRDYIRILIKRKNIILTLFAVSLLVTSGFLYVSVPLYTASSQVLIEKNSGKTSLESQVFYSYEPEFLETQSAIIRSENVAKKVIKNLEIQQKYRHYFLPEKSDKISSPGFSKFFRKSKEDQTVHNDATKEQDGIAAALEANKSEEEALASAIQSGLKVTPVKDTKIVSISYTTKDPYIAQIVADAVVKAYMDEMLDMKITLSSYSLKWMTEKAKEEKQRLESSEGELQKFMRDNDLVTVENKLTILPQKLSDYGTQLTKAEAEKDTLQEQIRLIQSVSNNLEKLENLPMFSNNEVLKNVREKIYTARQSKQELSNQFGPKHPKMIKINDELRILQDERKAEIDRVVSSLTNQYNLAVNQAKSLSETLKSTKSEVLNLNERFMAYSTMKRDADSNRVLYDTLQAGIKKESVTEQAQDVNIWVIMKAKKPGAASFPNKKKSLLIGLLIGLSLGIGCALIIEFLDNTVKKAKDIQERYGLNVLGTIELLREKDQQIESYLKDKPLSPLAESYRLIRTGLLLSSAEHPPKKILVTSMNPQEGKSSTTVNLARVLVQAHYRVVIVDCDLRRPRMNTILNVTESKGLSSFLAGNHEEKILRDLPEENIAFMPAGPIPPNPSELLSSEKMRRLIEELAEQYDFVLLDSPPVQSVTDSLALSRFADGTIVVVRSGKTTFEMLDDGLQKLYDVQARILGVVLNCFRASESGNYYYGYTSYYAKDSSDS